MVVLIPNRECQLFMYICTGMKVDVAEYVNIRNQTNNTGVWLKNLGEGSRHFNENVFSSNSRSHHFDPHLACMKQIHFNVFKSQRAQQNDRFNWNFKNMIIIEHWPLLALSIFDLQNDQPCSFRILPFL